MSTVKKDVQFCSPCVNHDECMLDIRLLKSDLKKLYEKIRAFKSLGYSPLEKAAYDAWSTNLKSTELREAYYSALYEHGEHYVRQQYSILCMIRAHHRGKVHHQWKRTGVGTVKKLTINDQERIIINGEYYSNKLWSQSLARYLRPVSHKCDQKPN